MFVGTLLVVFTLLLSHSEAKQDEREHQQHILGRVDKVDEWVLFGVGAGWSLDSWRTVDDRVRGGSSISHFIPSNENALFYGHLDTTTLGGAGFASQKFVPNVPFNFLSWSGLIITIIEGDGLKYAINLKGTKDKRRPDGRLESSIEYKFSFEGSKSQVIAPFSEFKPFFRGRPAPESPPLNKTEIYSLSFMIQSYFDQQKGDFKITMESIKLY
jgi:hypothetical protein